MVLAIILPLLPLLFSSKEHVSSFICCPHSNKEFEKLNFNYALHSLLRIEKKIHRMWLKLTSSVILGPHKLLGIVPFSKPFSEKGPQ